MIRQGEGIGVDIDIVIVLTVVVGKYPVEGIDNTEGGEMKIAALTEEITTSQRDRIIEKKGMKVLELWLVRIAIITSVPWVARQIILQLLLTKWKYRVKETQLHQWRVIERRVPVIRRVGTAIGQNVSVPHLQDQVTHQGHKEKTHHSNDDHTLVHLLSVVRLQVLKRKRRRVEEEGTGVQVLVLAVAEVEIGEDHIIVALPQAHVTAHRHQDCITVMATTSMSISAAVDPSVAVEVITRNRVNDDTKRIRRRARRRRRNMKVITLDRHEMIPSVTFAVVQAL